MNLESVLARRLAWNVVPAAIVVGALWASLAGEHGLLNRHKLKARLAGTQAEAAQVERDNARLRAEVYALKTDPLAVERAAAAVLLQAPEAATIYRLEAP